MSWLIVGTVPRADFGLAWGAYDVRGRSIEMPGASVNVARGTPALLATAFVGARTLGIDPPDALIIEGLTLRHPDTGPAGLLDALIYLDADEADLERWYVARFLELWEAAEHDPASFYARFRHMTREQTDGLARMVWRDVNLKNLHDHIIHARARADLVVAKAGDHSIASVSRP